MPKIYLKTEKQKKVSLDEIKKTLSENHACYVLLTCSNPTDKGEMHVEMNYEGDEILASYLVDNAQAVLQDQSQESRGSL